MGLFKKKEKAQQAEQAENDITQQNITQETQTEDDGFSDFDDFDSAGDQTEQSEISESSESSESYTEQEQYVEQEEVVEEPTQPVNKQPVSSQKTNHSAIEEMILYIIADKKQVGLLNYFRECGIKVSSLFNDITDAKNAVLMQSKPTRIVIIDSGQGRFTTTTMRAELIDMLGISDEQNKTTVFYTDSALKVDTLRSLGKAGKEIDWKVYSTTPVVAATILNYNELYVYDEADKSEQLEDSKSILSLKGLTFAGEETPRVDIKGFTSESILNNLVNNVGEELESYEIRL